MWKLSLQARCYLWLHVLAGHCATEFKAVEITPT